MKPEHRNGFQLLIDQLEEIKDGLTELSEEAEAHLDKSRGEARDRQSRKVCSSISEAMRCLEAAVDSMKAMIVGDGGVCCGRADTALYGKILCSGGNSGPGWAHSHPAMQRKEGATE